MKPLWIVKLGCTLAGLSRRYGDYEGWIAARLGLPGKDLSTVRPREGQPLPTPDQTAGIVITGSRDMVSDRLPWSEAVAEWLGRVVDAGVPVLGICYGHQLLAHALGGDVGRNPRGHEIGTQRIETLPAARDDPLLGFLADDGGFYAQCSHKESVLRLPEGAVLLARSVLEPTHAFRLGSCAWGVQFHPEFSEEVMRGSIRIRAGRIRRWGLDSNVLEEGVCPTPRAEAVLAQFGRLVCDRSQGRIR